MEILSFVGRIMFGGFFVVMGLMHFMKTKMLSEYAGSKGVSAPKAAVLLSGLLILLGGFGILLNIYIGWSVLFVVVFLLGVSFKMHDFWKNPQEMSNFTKNMALLGAALTLL